MEAALLSNTLHEYRDDDVDGARSVVAQILAKRQEWTRVRKDIDYFDKTGQLPQEAPARSVLTPLASSPALAELRVELGRLNTNISKYQKKLATSPEHKKAEQWTEDLAKMEALKAELKQQIVNLTYAAT